MYSIYSISSISIVSIVYIAESGRKERNPSVNFTDSALICQPRVSPVLGMVEARSVSVKKTTTTI